MTDGRRLLDSRFALRVSLVLVALPFLASFVAMVSAGDVGPRNHDVALIELRSSDVLGGDTPLVGSYERYGGNQPGPWLFWVLALPSLVGPLGIGAATLAVGYAAIAGTLWVARRRGGSVLVLWVAVLSVLLALGRGFDRLTDPWEPMITLLVIVLLVMLVWEVASGTIAALPWAVAVTWFLASSWLLLTPTATGLGVLLVVAVAVPTRSALRSDDPQERRSFLVWIGVSALVLVVMVLPTVLEQLTSPVGNLAELRSAAGSSEPTVGLTGAWRVLRLQFDPWAPWLGRAMPLTFSSEVDGSSAFAVPAALLVWLASIVALARTSLSRRRRDDAYENRSVAARGDVADAVGVGETVWCDPRPLWWLHAGVVATFIGLLVGLSLSRGGVAVWSMQPTGALAMLMWLAAGWTAATLVLRRRPVRWSERTAAVVGVLLVVVVGFASVVALLSDQGADRLPSAVAELASDVPDAVPVDRGPVLVTSDAEVREVFESDDFGVAEMAASLERLGYRTRVRSELSSKFGDRRADGDDATGELRLTSGDVAPDGSGWTRIGRVDPLDSRQRARRERLDRDLESRSDGLEGADLLRKAAEDPRLAALVRESSALPSEPVLLLWYRAAFS